MKRLPCAAMLFLSVLAASPGPVRGGVVNPDISVVGQPQAVWSDAPGLDRKRLRMGLGETEVIFDSALNPYARGWVNLSLGEQGIGVEEAYFTLNRGLPAALTLKAGKYRVGFGKLNPSHPHTWPFADRFAVLSRFLPGDESLNETGISLSRRLPAPGEMAIDASADLLQGDTFHPATADSSGGVPDLRAAETRPALLGRIDAFTLVGERSGLELGADVLHGTSNVSAGTRSTVYGADLKTKLWSGPSSYLWLQAEGLHLRREEPSAREIRSSAERHASGGYLFADFNFSPRYDAGASVEAVQQLTEDRAWDYGFGLFAGLSLMEETTSFRLDWKRFQPGTPASSAEEPHPARPAAENKITLRAIFSMGPHKAHQF